jgi:hypothetical protein
VEEAGRRYDVKIVTAGEGKNKLYGEIERLRKENQLIFGQVAEGLELWRIAWVVKEGVGKTCAERDRIRINAEVELARAKLLEISDRFQALLSWGPPEEGPYLELQSSARLWQLVLRKAEQELTLNEEMVTDSHGRIKAVMEQERSGLKQQVARLFSAAAEDPYFAGYGMEAYSLEERKPKAPPNHFNFGELPVPANDSGRRDEGHEILLRYARWKAQEVPDAVIVADQPIVADSPGQPKGESHKGQSRRQPTNQSRN